MIDQTVKFIQDDSIRRELEEQEVRTLSPRACLSINSLGREHPEKDCFIRTCFQRDAHRIIQSESFRRLKHKTQVFLSPANDHFRTRMTHTLEVVAIARCISRALKLNSDLTEAIGYGHDLGHTPFGHSGETVLNEISETGFHHASHSVRVVKELEKAGKGLNLSAEVIDGIGKHSKGRKGAAAIHDSPDAPITLEGQVVRIADLIAYINDDIDHSIRAGVIKNEDLPKEARSLLGERHSQRIHNMVKDIIFKSRDLEFIRMSQPVFETTEVLKAYLYEKIYPRPEISEEVEKSKKLLHQMAYWFLENPKEMFARLKHPPPREQSVKATLVDYLASMTDGFAIRMFKELFVPHERLDSSLFLSRSR